MEELSSVGEAVPYTSSGGGPKRGEAPRMRANC